MKKGATSKNPRKVSTSLPSTTSTAPNGVVKLVLWLESRLPVSQVSVPLTLAAMGIIAEPVIRAVRMMW